ncbi:MAG: PhoH family protein [Peptococcaceae bacterium]|jgi:phosphate starvation-inducible PhoH-like protein|nr:PhoH family protein [Peptococcaceae bacterium]
MEIEEKILLSDNGQAVEVLGEQDSHIRLIERELDVKIVVRGGEATILGAAENVAKCKQVLKYLADIAAKGGEITAATVAYGLKMNVEAEEKIADKLSHAILVTAKGKQVRAKTVGQYDYLENIRKNDLTFCIGPAGTGKTYLAVVMAVQALKNKEVRRIVLARPAVEAGEKLGFLPGDLQEKVNPYLRPVYDALDDILGYDMARKYMERNIVEVVPLAYMRGRTLEDAFIILDEAQNTTSPQMKMFLTRLGMGSKAVITGDVTQIDLPKGDFSGLAEAEQKLKNISGIAFSYLTKVDVVRHPLVEKIIAAYEEHK